MICPQSSYFPLIIFQQNMSLIRKSSRTNLRPTLEDTTQALQHKNALIVTLNAQADTLRPKQEQTQRLTEDLRKARTKYEALLNEHQTVLMNNEERLEMSAKTVTNLRGQVQLLEDEARIRAQALKDAKYEVQRITDLSQRKEEETLELQSMNDDLATASEAKRGEEERFRQLVGQVREELNKGKREGSLAREQTDSFKEKTLKTHSYLRNLLREEGNLNENLALVEDENSRLTASISELDTMVAVNNGQICNKQRDCQQAQFHISSMQLEKQRWQRENQEKLKQLGHERTRMRSANDQLEAGRKQAAQLDEVLAETATEINFILGRNDQIREVNSQLTQDLKVCQRHMENVLRVNRGLEQEVATLQQTSLKAIARLQQPFTNRTNHARFESSGSWEKHSRGEVETGDFDCWGASN